MEAYSFSNICTSPAGTTNSCTVNCIRAKATTTVINIADLKCKWNGLSWQCIKFLIINYQVIQYNGLLTRMIAIGFWTLFPKTQYQAFIKTLLYRNVQKNLVSGDVGDRKTNVNRPVKFVFTDILNKC